MRLLHFNPENDLALASADPHYTPPASALALATDIQEMPCLWASVDDVIWNRDGSLVDACGERLYDSLSEVAHDITSVFPWGWSPLLVQRLLSAGLPKCLLPSDAEMNAYRTWASRHTAVHLLRRLRATWPQAFAPNGPLCGMSSWCVTEEEVIVAHERFGRSMFKAPWSGSGRGIRPVPEGVLGERDRAWVQSILCRQGGVEVEPFYAKVQDMAMEFWVEGGRVRYEGLSLFHTTPGGVYNGNMVAAEALKEEWLARFIDINLLRDLRPRLTLILNEAGIPSWYTGPLGVDMMVLPERRLHPLVEVNLRATMGWVALHLGKDIPRGQWRQFGIDNDHGRYTVRLTDGNSLREC